MARTAICCWQAFANLVASAHKREIQSEILVSSRLFKTRKGREKKRGGAGKYFSACSCQPHLQRRNQRRRHKFLQLVTSETKPKDSSPVVEEQNLDLPGSIQHPQKKKNGNHKIDMGKQSFTTSYVITTTKEENILVQ